MEGNQIQIVDLKGQYLKIKSEVDQAIQSVLYSTAFIKGKDVGNFEKNLAEYLGAKHVIACGNGTDALQIAVMALDLKPGDEVITPSFTFVSAVEVICLLGLTPVFAEVNPRTFNIDPDDLKRKITSRTKAIVPVHLYGQCADMSQIMQIAREHNLPVIEDTAQAIGAKYTFTDGTKISAGCMGAIGTTSFFPSKNLGCYGDGGAVYCNDDVLAEKLRQIANHGQKVKYNYDRIGVNSRLDTIQATVLNIKLKYLEEYNKARQEAADYYDSRLNGCPHLQIPERNLASTHVFHQYTLVMDKPENKKMVEYLSANKIPSMIYYPEPIHLQKGYLYLGYKDGDLPVSERLSKSVFSLPMHTELTRAQQDVIIETVLKYYK
jgi:dTDP-4-amino-4,6-dideoxygalactose transaminase